MTRTGVVGVFAGVWAVAVFISCVALAGQPRTPQVTTTQRAVVTPQAFAPGDPVMKDPRVASMLSPTMVSAEFKSVRLLEAFAELSKQTGYTIEPYGGGQTRYGTVTATIKNQPFWAAMREICTRGNVGLYYYGDEEPDKIQLLPTNYGQQHMLKAATSIKGPYMTVVTDLERVNTVMMATPEKTTRNVNVQIYTFAEPKARPTQYAYQPVVDEAVDDHGNSMAPDQNDRQQHMQSSRGIAFYGYVQLKYPETNPGTKIARLRGHIDAKVQLQSEPVEIDKPLEARDVTRTVGDKKITLKSLTKNSNGNYTAEIVFHRGDSEDQQTFQQDAFRTEPLIKLSDSAKGRYQVYSSGGRGGTDEVMRQFQINRRSGGGGGQASSANAPDPDKLVIEISTATQDVAIPFELVDLPLP